jgi:hypothetical protein
MILIAIIGCAAPVWPGAWADKGASAMAGLIAQAAAILIIIAGTVKLGPNLTPFPAPAQTHSL